MSNELIQSIVAFSVVFVAAGYIGRRLWDQVSAFRDGKDNDSSPCGSCGACGDGGKQSDQLKSAPVQLISLSTAPPRRVPNAVIPPDRKN
jgi:hypothetical protein